MSSRWHWIASLFADDHGCQKRHCQFVMTGDGVTAAGVPGGWPANYVGQWAVGLNEVEIRRGDVDQLMAEVTHQCHALQKNFGQRNRRTHVEIDTAAVHSAHELCQQAKICVRGCTQGGAICTRVKVGDIAADRYMGSEGYPRFVSRAQQRVIAVPGI